jgi:hypothetical protein
MVYEITASCQRENEIAKNQGLAQCVVEIAHDTVRSFQSP